MSRNWTLRRALPYLFILGCTAPVMVYAYLRDVFAIVMMMTLVLPVCMVGQLLKDRTRTNA